MQRDTTHPEPVWQIIGQGLAGTCLAWEFFNRKIPFRIIDSGHGGSSRVAAGMVNPITGKNFEPSWLIEEFHPAAIRFYEKIEATLNSKFWHPLPVLRLATSEKEWSKISSKLDQERVLPWLSTQQPETPSGFVGAVELTGGGRVDAAGFIAHSAEYFSNAGILETGHHELARPHPRRILCEGALGLMRDQLGPHRCAKGEILTVGADWPETHIRIGAGGWLVPIGDGLFRVGSTYEWNQLDDAPTEQARERISEIARRLGGASFTITDHVAGIRPILRRSEPLIGKNASGEWIFNGLGSKGSLYAPRMASLLADWVQQGTRPPEEFILPPL